MRRSRPHTISFLFASVLSLAIAAPSRGDVADTLYTGGDIITMRGPQPEMAEALAVNDGTILFVGPLAEAKAHVGPATTTIDLAGKTLLPGFIDTHGHFVYFGKNLVDADLFGCSDIPDLLARMNARGVPCAPLYNYSQVLADPQVKHMNWVEDITLPNGTPTKTVVSPQRVSGQRLGVRRAPPALGAHTDEILSELKVRS